MRRSTPWAGALILLAAWAAARAAEVDPKAAAVAERVMAAMGGRAAFESRRLLRFDFAVERGGETVAVYHHWWDRPTGRYRVEGKTREGKEYRAIFNIKDKAGKVWLDGSLLAGAEAEEFLDRAHGRFINDTYWLLMPWKWLDPGVSLAYEGERELDGKRFDVVRLSFDKGIGLTSNDRYWGLVDQGSGRMERWEYVLEKDDGSPGDEAPSVFAWTGWSDAGGGVLLSTRKERVGGEGPPVAITFPVASFSDEVPDEVFNPILRPPAAAPPAETTGAAPSATGLKEALVVLNKSDHTAALIETEFFEVVRTIPTGIGPHEGAVSPDGKTLYVSNYGAAAPGDTLTEIDLPAGTVRRTVNLGANRRPHGLAVGPDGSIWVTTEESRSVLRLSPKELKVEKVYQTAQDGTHMIVLSPDGKRAFTANIGSGTVTAIDTATGATQSAVTGKGAEGIDITPDGKEVWVAHRDESDVAILDAVTLKILARLKTGARPIRVKVTPDGKRVLVTCSQSNELRIFDRTTRLEAGNIRLDGAPIGILIAPGGKLAFIANTQADQVSIVDLERLELLGSFYAGREPDGMVWAKW